MHPKEIEWQVCYSFQHQGRTSRTYRHYETEDIARTNIKVAFRDGLMINNMCGTSYSIIPPHCITEAEVSANEAVARHFV